MDLDQREMRRSIRRVVAAADAEAIAAGEAWYASAHAAAVSLADSYGVTVETAAGVIAALSPRQRWARNLVVAAAVLANPAERPSGVFGQSYRAAARIASGEHWSDVLQGPKVRAFAANILGDFDQVTVDVWALRAAGLPDGGITRKRYDQVAEAFRAVALQVNLAPAVLQAVAWVAIRGAAA